MASNSDQYISQFKEYLLADGKSASTLESYLGDIQGFISWLYIKEAIFSGAIKRYQITTYRNYLLENNFKMATINKKINSLRCFNYFLVLNKYMDELVVYPNKDKVKLATGSEKEVKIFTLAEIERLTFFVQDTEKVSIRDRLIVTLLLFTGLRVSELVNVKLKDIDLLTLGMTVTFGKGGKQREIPLRTEVVESIKEYLEAERRNSRFVDSEFLLLSERAGKLDRDTVNKVLKKLEKLVGIEMHPHKYRHTFCTMLVKKGVELTTVAKLAGHSNIQTTASFYVNTSRQDKRNAVEML